MAREKSMGSAAVAHRELFQVQVPAPSPARPRQWYEANFPVEGPRVVVSAVHDLAVRRTCALLEHFLTEWRDYPRCKLTSDVYVHWGTRPARPDRRVAPDVCLYLDFRAEPGERVHHVERDGPPNFIVEVLSRDSWEDDGEYKRGLYEMLGVFEYWILDPDGFLQKNGGLLGWRLDTTGTYREIAAKGHEMAGGHRRLWFSRILEAFWGLTDAGTLRIFDSAARHWYPTLSEQRLAEREGRLQAEDRYRALIQRLRAEHPNLSIPDGDDLAGLGGQDA